MTSTIDLTKPPSQTADFSQIWPFLKAGVHKVMDSPEEISATEYMNLSVTVYNLALRSGTCALALQKNLVEIFIERVQSIANQAAKMVDVDLLRYYVKEFHGYKTDVERVNRVFAFYNHRWAKKVEGGLDVILPVDSLGLIQWKENCALVIQGDGRKITSAILNLLMKERNGEEIEEGLVKEAIDSFITLDVDHRSPAFYQEEFAAPFLQEMADYYQKEFESAFQSENFIPDYLNKVEEKLLGEERRAKRYLPQQTHKVIRTLLIRDRCEALVQVLLQSNDDAKLREMSTFLSRIKPDGTEALKESIELHFRTESGGGLGDEPHIVPGSSGETLVGVTNMQSLRLVLLEQLGQSGPGEIIDTILQSLVMAFKGTDSRESCLPERSSEDVQEIVDRTFQSLLMDLSGGPYSGKKKKKSRAMYYQ